MPKTVAIIGAGLAGAACANAFAHTGANVSVFEQGAAPAAGASGVPLAMFAPSISSDDAPHSRLLRSGVHLLLDELRRLTADGLLTEWMDWALTGVLERCIRGDKQLPAAWLEPQDPPALQSRLLSKPNLVQELFHGAAGWVNPAKLIAAWLTHTNITVQTNTQVADWNDALLQRSDVIVVAAGYQTPELVRSLGTRLQPIRGQVQWGVSSGTSQPTNGMGHWIESSGMWLAGATFQRDELSLEAREKDIDLNFSKLAVLRPELEASRLANLRAMSQPWVGIRTAQKNRQPLVMQPDSRLYPQLWVCTGFGSRGLSLAALCALQLLARL